MVDHEMSLEAALQVLLHKSHYNTEKLRLEKCYMSFLQQLEVYLKHITVSLYPSPAQHDSQQQQQTQQVSRSSSSYGRGPTRGSDTPEVYKDHSKQQAYGYNGARDPTSGAQLNRNLSKSSFNVGPTSLTSPTSRQQSARSGNAQGNYDNDDDEDSQLSFNLAPRASRTGRKKADSKMNLRDEDDANDVDGRIKYYNNNETTTDSDQAQPKSKTGFKMAWM